MSLMSFAMNRIWLYIVIGILLIILIGKCGQNNPSTDYKYKQEKLSLQIDSLTAVNDTYFDSIVSLNKEKVKPLEKKIEAKKEVLKEKNLVPDVRDTIIKYQDTLIIYKDREIEYRDTIINNLQIKEVRYESKLELKDLELKDEKRSKFWRTVKTVLITAISTAIIIGVIYLIK